MIPIDIQVRKYTNLWKLKCQDQDSNPGPVAPQAQSLTTLPPPFPSISAVNIITCNTMVLYIIRVIKTDGFPNQNSNLSFFSHKIHYSWLYI